jgi:hypothetical protein
MEGDVHFNRALSRANPAPGQRFRQIVIIERHGYQQLRIYEGDVILAESQFEARSDEAAVYLHNTLKQATFDAEMEFDDSVREGWIPYNQAA